MALLSKADLHIHTQWSDGTATVPQLLHHVAAHTDLRVIAITDHDSIGGVQEAQRLAPEFGLEVIAGEEVSTSDGHLLALFIDEFVPPGRPAAETIARVHAQGGLCIAPHPYDWASPSLGRRCGAWNLDALEVFNASLTWPRHQANLTAQRVARELHIPAVGGSDAHSLATVGRAYTEFAGSTANDLYRAIQHGDVSWGGRLWSMTHYLDVARLYVRQRHLAGAIRLALSDGASPLHHP